MYPPNQPNRPRRLGGYNSMILLDFLANKPKNPYTPRARARESGFIRCDVWLCLVFVPQGRDPQDQILDCRCDFYPSSGS